MKKLIAMTGCLLMVITLASCATYPFPMVATGNELGPKVGRASDNICFGWFGDASGANIPAAVRNGNITRISTVDVQVSNTGPPGPGLPGRRFQKTFLC